MPQKTYRVGQILGTHFWDRLTCPLHGMTQSDQIVQGVQTGEVGPQGTKAFVTTLCMLISLTRMNAGALSSLCSS